MMQKSARRKLSKAPLAYVVAQVRFAPILAMEKLVPDIQEELRKAGYPDYKPVLAHSIKLNLGSAGGGESPELRIDRVQWDFVDKESKSGFILSTDSFAYQTTAYETHEPFIESFRRGLEVVHRHAKIDLTTRLGLRYVDVIVPVEGDSLPGYLQPGLEGFPASQIVMRDPVISVETLATTELGLIRMRCLQTGEGINFPGDLMPIRLTLPLLPVPAGRNATLDFDHFSNFEKPIDFSVADVVARLHELHKVTSRAFFVTVTEHALERWA